MSSSLPPNNLGPTPDQLIDGAASKFISSDLWESANWNATTFKWHPSSAAPPIMGIGFQNALRAHELFGVWNELKGNEDTAEDLGVSIIEGNFGGQSGYVVHIYAEVSSGGALVADNRSADGARQALVFSRVNRMYPKGGASTLLDKFKREYEKHGEYLLAPVTRRGEKEWVDVELGIVKSRLNLRRMEDIHGGDVDIVAINISKRIAPAKL